MEVSYKFALIRLSPDSLRGERLNVGVIVWHKEWVDVRYPRSLEKVRALSHALTPEMITGLLSEIEKSYAKLSNNNVSSEVWRTMIFGSGPLSLSQTGTFVAENQSSYDARIESLLADFVNPEPAPKIIRDKRTRLLTQMKKLFRSERVLAKKDEDLSSHRIVPSVTIDEGLRADLVLKNGKYHVVETVDISVGGEFTRKVIADIGVSSLVLERARMKFGAKQTNSLLVYSASPALEKVISPSLAAVEHQNAQLVNWESEKDRRAFIGNLSSLALPYKGKSKIGQTFIHSDHQEFKFH